MRTLLFLAVFALATQVHMSEVTEFYRTFINTIPMDVQTKNRVMNNGLDCINQAVDTIANSVQNIQYDVQSKDLVSTLRHAISSVQVFENTVLPKCAQTYMELMSYIQEHRNRNNSAVINSWDKSYLFEARLKQLVAKTVVDVLNKQPNAAAKDLATFIGTAAGLMDPEFPSFVQFDWDKYVKINETKMIPEFLKGFFNGIGIYDSVKINATSQCALDLLNNLEAIATNPAVARGDFYTRANAFLDSAMKITDSLERCKKLNLVDTDMIQRLVQLFNHYPAESIITVLSNNYLNLPNITASEISTGVLMSHGQYEAAGRMYAQKVRTVYQGLLF